MKAKITISQLNSWEIKAVSLDKRWGISAVREKQNKEKSNFMVFLKEIKAMICSESAQTIS